MTTRAVGRMKRDAEGGLVLSPQQTEYLSWLLMSPEQRLAEGLPDSQAKYAKHVDIDEGSLRRWKRNPEFVKEWDDRSKADRTSPERVQKLLDDLFQRGMDGSARHAELWLKAAGVLKAAEREASAPPRKGSVETLSDEDLAEALASAARLRGGVPSQNGTIAP